MNQQALMQELSADEGRKKRIYVDTKGKVTGGVGRNLSDRDFSDDEIDLMLSNDIKGVCADLDRVLPWWRNISDARQRVLANMCFNMGIDRLLGFHNTLRMIASGMYQQASVEMLNSQWAKDVGDRAKRLSKMMREG